MEKFDETKFDTDLDDGDDDDDDYDDDDETGIGQFKEISLPRISFDKKLLGHRSNSSDQSFGQTSVPFESKADIRTYDRIFVPLRHKTYNRGRMRLYEKCCHLLDVTMDWELRSLLGHDNISVLNRSLNFNHIYAFSTAIQANLQSLILSSVGLTPRSISILCQGLKKCIHLNLLDLSWNKINKECFEILLDTINSLPSLLYLSLSNCAIRDSNGRSVGDLCRHRKLIDINLSGNQFEESACIFIGSALTENMSLKNLNVAWNFIRSYAAIALLRGLEISKTVTDFDISWSNLAYEGSVALGRVIKVNRFITRLNISNCNINWASAKLISDGLEKNSTLQKLNFSFNPLTTHGVQIIVEAVDHRRSVLSVLEVSVRSINSFLSSLLNY